VLIRTSGALDFGGFSMNRRSVLLGRMFMHFKDIVQ